MKKSGASGKMRIIHVQKAVVNIGVGEAGEKLIKAEKVLGMLTNRTPVRTVSIDLKAKALMITHTNILQAPRRATRCKM